MEALKIHAENVHEASTIAAANFETVSSQAEKVSQASIVYGYARPVLDFVAHAWFVPSKIKVIIVNLETVLDALLNYTSGA